MSEDFLDFDISVAAAKQKAESKRRGDSSAFDTSRHKCHVKGCNKTGTFRAPVAPDRLNEFWWFCEEHISQYNIQWNYYDNPSPRHMAENQHRLNNSDTANKGQFSWTQFRLDDSLEVLEEKRAKDQISRRVKPKLNMTEKRAVTILNLEQFTRAEARKQYRMLVKDLHPDMNQGNRADESRLREVVWAWEQIKNNRKFKD